MIWNLIGTSAYTETGFISCFAETLEAAEFLTYKRGR